MQQSEYGASVGINLGWFPLQERVDFFPALVMHTTNRRRLPHLCLGFSWDGIGFFRASGTMLWFSSRRKTMLVTLMPIDAVKSHGHSQQRAQGAGRERN